MESPEQLAWLTNCDVCDKSNGYNETGLPVIRTGQKLSFDLSFSTVTIERDKMTFLAKESVEVHANRHVHNIKPERIKGTHKVQTSLYHIILAIIFYVIVVFVTAFRPNVLHLIRTDLSSEIRDFGFLSSFLNLC